MYNKETVLIIDDDKDIVNLISDILEDEGYNTEKVYNGKDALEILLGNRFNLVLLDVMLPDIDGFEICKRIRDKISCPIIFITAKGKSYDKVVGLEVGADDYITKPFDDNELLARVKAHIRREKRSKQLRELNEDILKQGNIILNKKSYEVYVSSTKADLSTREFQILLYLMENSNKVLSREQIYSGVWGYEDYGDINTVTVHIKKLREKVDKDGVYIKTIWGAGYKFIGD